MLVSDEGGSRLTDLRFAHAIARTYNDWLHEFCQADPDRMLGERMISVYDAVQETHLDGSPRRSGRLSLHLAAVVQLVPSPAPPAKAVHQGKNEVPDYLILAESRPLQPRIGMLRARLGAGRPRRHQRSVDVRRLPVGCGQSCHHQ